MTKCEKCNHDCHCKNQEHIDEYLDICPCGDCKCKRTYVYEKDHGHDISYENEVEYD